MKTEQMRIRIAADNGPAIVKCAEFIAELVKNGLTFEATLDGAWMIIVLTGGF